MKNKQGMKIARQLLSIQLGVGVVTVSFMAGCCKFLSAFSAGLGFLVYLLPNAYFFCAFFLRSEPRFAQKIVRAIYRGEALKLLLSAVLFTLVFKCFKVEPVAFLGAYIAAQMTFWLTPILLKSA